MLQVEQHGDVTRFEMTSVASRILGYSASAYLIGGVLVDCGFHSARKEIDAILDREQPRGVLITHHHEDHAGKAKLLGAVPEPRRLHLHPVDAVQDEERALDDAKRGNRVGLEAGIPGRVDEIQLAVLPPLTRTIWPVMKEAFSEATKATASAISSGLAPRLSGTAA